MAANLLPVFKSNKHTLSQKFYLINEISTQRKRTYFNKKKISNSKIVYWTWKEKRKKFDSYKMVTIYI